MKIIFECDSVNDILALRPLIDALDRILNGGVADQNISVLGLQIYVENALIRSGIRTLGDLTACTEWYLLSLQNVGKKAVVQIKDSLERLNLQLKQ